MTDPQPVDGDVRFVDWRWERYDRDRGWIPIDPPAFEGEAPRGGSNQVYRHPRPDG